MKPPINSKPQLGMRERICECGHPWAAHYDSAHQPCARCHCDKYRPVIGGRKRVDPDISALKVSVKALNKSTSLKMLRANIEFLVDRFLTHPSPDLPPHLRKAQIGGA